jgi:hypothetical protein
MSPVRLNSRILLTALALSLSFGPTAAAQQPKVLAPHVPVAPKIQKPFPWAKPKAQQSAAGGLWMTGPNMKSSLYLRSDLKTDPLTVTPVIYLSNGVRYPLPPVTLAPTGTAIVDIGQALDAQGVAPYATLYGYVEIDYQWPWPALCATIKNVDALHSLVFTSFLQRLPGAFPPSAIQTPTHSFEGLWWKQEPSVSGFLALVNLGSQSVNATVTVTDGNNAPLGSYQLTIAPNLTKMIDLAEIKSSASNVGGLYLTHDGPEHSLAINGGLSDDAVGYSAHLSLMPVPQSPPQGTSPAVSSLSYAELGLMSGFADPMMAFPSGTVFTPYTVVRNISNQPASVTPTLWWMTGGTAHSAQVAQITLAPHQTINLNVPNLLTTAGLKNLNGSVNLTLDTTAPAGALTSTGGSVDQKNTYVFEVPPRGVAESAAKNLSYWSTGNGDDTMISIWNPADEAQDFVFTLFYSGGHYLHPVHLEARASLMFNVSEITHSQIPDSEGNVIPAGIHEGSAEISGTQGEQQHILVAIDAGIYNVQKAICVYPCPTCSGIDIASMIDAQFNVPIGAQKQQTFYVQWNTGNQYDMTGSSNWYSSATNVATVATGTVSGIAPGSTNIDAVTLYYEPIYVEYDCNVSCPAGTFQASSSGNVMPTVTFGNTPLVPLGKPVPTTATVKPPNNTTQITLTISTTSGMGAAIFLGGSTTITITTTTSVTLVGVTASSTPNNMELDAKVGSTIVGSMIFTVTGAINGAIPVNYRQTAFSVQSSASLHFEYMWDSSTGNLADLSACQIEEYVTYVGPNPYPWPSPPYLANQVTPWPELGLTPVSANNPKLNDDHGHAAGWQTPYVFKVVASDQVYQFQCPYYQNNQWVQLMPINGQIPIDRVVSLPNGNPPWTYTITKSGQSASMTLP